MCKIDVLLYACVQVRLCFFFCARFGFLPPCFPPLPLLPCSIGPCTPIIMSIEHPWLCKPPLPLLVKSCFLVPFWLFGRAHPRPDWPSVVCRAPFPCLNPHWQSTTPIQMHECPPWTCIYIQLYVCHVVAHFAMFAMCCLVLVRACLVCLSVCLGVFPLRICPDPNPERMHSCCCPFVGFS